MYVGWNRFLGVCYGDRKEPFVTGSERAGRCIGGEKRRQVRRKNDFETAKSEGGHLILCFTNRVNTPTI